MKTKQLVVNCKIILGTILIAVFWVLISEIGIVFILPWVDFRKHLGWPVLVFELLLEGLAIGLMIWRYKQHSQIIAFPLKNRWQQYCWGFIIGLFWFTIVWLIAVLNKGFMLNIFLIGTIVAGFAYF